MEKFIDTHFSLKLLAKTSFLLLFIFVVFIIYATGANNISEDKQLFRFNRDHSFSTYAKCSEKLTFLTP